MDPTDARPDKDEVQAQDPQENEDSHLENHNKLAQRLEGGAFATASLSSNSGLARFIEIFLKV